MSQRSQGGRRQQEVAAVADELALGTESGVGAVEWEEALGPRLLALRGEGRARGGVREGKREQSEGLPLRGARAMRGNGASAVREGKGSHGACLRLARRE